MTQPAHQKFEFDTVFDGAGDVTFEAPRPKRLFPAEEVEILRAEAFAAAGVPDRTDYARTR